MAVQTDFIRLCLEHVSVGAVMGAVAVYAEAAARRPMEPSSRVAGDIDRSLHVALYA